MKKVLLLFMIIIPLAVLSQSKKPINGFLNVPFGSDSVAVKSALLSKGATQDYSLTEKDYIVFKDFILSDRKVFLCIIKLWNNKVYEANFFFNDFTGENLLSYYDSLSADINAVYGNGELINNFRPSETNSDRVYRLRLGQEVCKTLWQSENSTAIALEFRRLEDKLYIALTYQDEALLNASHPQKKSDF